MCWKPLQPPPMTLTRELMAAALDWREHGPPTLPLRGDELASELGLEPGPELGRLIDELDRFAAATGDDVTVVFDPQGDIIARAKRLHGARICMDLVTVTGRVERFRDQLQLELERVV